MRSPRSSGRWLIFGSGGMLGADVSLALAGRHVTAPPRTEVDLTDASAVADMVAGHDVVVNCAAWTGVDAAEEHEPEAFAVNALGAANVARACRSHDAWLVHVSTDYVFSGVASQPYTEDAPVAPVSAYGRTKAAGEWAVQAYASDRSFLVRTAWLYGAAGSNFVRTMIRLAAERRTLDVVDDQRGQPTWSADLASRLVALVDANAPAGVYHGTNSGETTWFGFAQRIFTLLGKDPERVQPVSSDQVVRPAPRPAYSVLGQDGWTKAGLPPMRSWQEALDQAFPAIRALS